MKNLVLACALGALFSLPPVATAQPEQNVSQPQTGADAIRARLKSLNDEILDPKVQFSASRMLFALNEVKKEIEAHSDLKLEKREIHYLIGLVEYKREGYEAAIEAWKASLAVETSTPLEPESTLLRWHLLGRCHDKLGHYDLAAEAYSKSYTIAKDLSSYPPEKRFGIKEAIGFSLHEGKRFTEALHSNEDLLREAQALWGPDNERLRNVLQSGAKSLRAETLSGSRRLSQAQLGARAST